ncbi:hypothetical protein ACL9RF_10055 [Sphingobacterium sp. Mn56C]|uniref:hypothetical protein n=1 Tax=Sphingobacterium sp. Mn56C TaxID=3395261 RepID=UPI003BDB5884
MFDETAGTYGDGSSTYAKYTGVAEAWSHFIEYQLMQQIGLLGKERYAILMTAYTQSSSPSTIPSTDGDGANLACWIPSGLFRDLISKESREVELKDGKNYSTTLLSSVTPVVGFTYSQLYRFLTNDVRSVTDLKNKIIQYYPHKNTNHEITRLFQLYGY